MAVEIFAKLGDIKGESVDAKHADEIEVLSFSWGIASGGSTGAAAGKAAFKDLTFVHAIDRASPALWRACATGMRLKEGTITHRRTGHAQPEFIIVKLSDILVTSVTHGGDVLGNSETVSLAFGKVDFEYRPRRPDGSLEAGVHFVFDLVAQRAG